MERAVRAEGHATAIIQLLNAEMQKIMAQPETRQKLLSLGLNVGVVTEQLAEFGRAERRKWGPIISAAELKLSDRNSGHWQGVSRPGCGTLLHPD